MKITVIRKSAKSKTDCLRGEYTLTCDKLPGRVFGPFDFISTRNELFVLGDLTPVAARNLIFMAWTFGSASRETGE